MGSIDNGGNLHQEVGSISSSDGRRGFNGDDAAALHESAMVISIEKWTALIMAAISAEKWDQPPQEMVGG